MARTQLLARISATGSVKRSSHCDRNPREQLSSRHILRAQCAFWSGGSGVEAPGPERGEGPKREVWGQKWGAVQHFSFRVHVQVFRLTGLRFSPVETRERGQNGQRGERGEGVLLALSRLFFLSQNTSSSRATPSVLRCLLPRVRPRGYTPLRTNSQSSLMICISPGTASTVPPVQPQASTSPHHGHTSDMGEIGAPPRRARTW